jgi:hypothetical protein
MVTIPLEGVLYLVFLAVFSLVCHALNVFLPKSKSVQQVMSPGRYPRWKEDY